jgi:EAL domain-containing protein (putative c-di-GMP-specific phosphodiesterase class I)
LGEAGQVSEGTIAAAGTAAGTLLGTGFQPIYAARDGTLAGHEALIRAVDAAGLPVSPAAFFSAAQPGEIVGLDRACRRVHLAQFASQDAGDAPLHLNVHPLAALEDARARFDLRLELGLHGIRPARVCVEILEGECGDEDRLAEAVAAYRAVGLRIAMDDFGFERSNFDRVAALRPDFVKIDRLLLSRAVGPAGARRLLPSLVRLLHEADTQVIVEGIEDASEALFAIETGADFLQGYYFGPPRPTLAADPLPSRLMAGLRRVAAGATDFASPDLPAGAAD